MKTKAILAAAGVLALAGIMAAWLWREEPAAHAEIMNVATDDVLFGDRAAPVRIVAYMALTCAPCGEFHRTVVPRLKADWLDSGRAVLVYRDFPADDAGLAVAIYARCLVGSRRDRAPQFTDLFFQQQATLLAAEDPIQGLSRLSREIDRTGFDRLCLDNPMMENAILRSRDAAMQHGVKSAPTFFIEGKKLRGAPTWAELEKHLVAAGRAN